MFHRLHHGSTFSIVAYACSLMATMGQPVVAQSGDSTPKEPLIHATGTGRVQHVPDYVDVSVGVEVIEASASAAQAGAETVMKATVAAIRGMKLADEELQTGSVQLSPRYERNHRDEAPAKVIGYTGAITLNIRTSDLESPARIIDAALKSGCNRVQSVDFGIKELLAAREEAIKLATKAAKRKAEVMAEALDMKLTRVANASTQSINNFWSGSNRLGNMAQVASDGGGGDGGDGSAMVPGKVEVLVDVSISFVAAPRS